MTFWLSQERGTDVEEALARFPHNPDGSENPVRTLLGTLLTGSKGMDASADFLMEFFGQDQDAYMDLIVDLGSYVAACVEILDGLKVSSVEESLEQLEVMLRGFYDAPAEPEF
ncbi:hypothetical protein [Streptomyces sp. NPDC051546]|uniref:hypothetical protein n=1 Tax=Streptomyces sp. NPDC051546 TaxID=3365655 RepID=UPI003793979F